MDGEVIKSFLVGLGFGVDESSLSKFNRALTSATVKVTALYASIKVAAAGIAFGISKISEDFERMGYEYHIIAPQINKALLLRRELLKAYSLAGINIQQVVRDSLKLNLSLTKTKFAFEAIYKSVASRFFATLTKQSDLFRQRIYANMPKIQAVLERLINFIFKALDATTALGLRLWSILSRVYDFFVKLDEATDGWSTKIIAAIAIWKLFNLSFLATPIGLLFSLGVAVLALYDDFKTFKEGGQSLINWASTTTQAVVGLVAVITALAAAIYAVVLAMRAYAVISAVVRTAIAAWTAIQGALNIVLLANPLGLVIAGVTALIGLVGLLIFKWDTLKKSFNDIFGGGIVNFLSNIGSKVLDFAGGANIGAKLQGNPLGSSVAHNNAQTNQNLQQQTNIHITGSPDATSTARAVSGEQGRINFDLARNFSSAVKAGGFLQ